MSTTTKQPSAAAPAESRSGFLARLRPRAAAATVWYLRLIALLNLVAVLLVPFRTTVRHHSEGQFFTPYLMTAGLTSAVLSLFLAVAMRRRKRAAWIFNMGLSGFTFLVYVLWLSDPGEEHYDRHGFNYFSAVLTGLFVLALLVGRKEFVSKGDRSNPKMAVGTFIGGLLLGGVIGAVLVGLNNALPGAGLGDRFGYAVGRMVSIDPSEHAQDVIDVPTWVNAFINAMGAVLFLLVLYVTFRSPRDKELLDPDDELRLRELLDRQGERDSLGYFALRRDKAVIFSPTGKAAVAYRVVGGVSLASGDPIGDPEAWPGAIEQWLARGPRARLGAGRHGRLRGGRGDLRAARPERAGARRRGDRRGGRVQPGGPGRCATVRQAYNRVKRAGYTIRIRRHEDIPEEEMAQLLVHRPTAGATAETERGFSMALGRLGDPADGECVMIECHDAEGELRAVLSFVPWGENGLSLDLMRRDRETDNGLVEFMVIELLEQAKEIERGSGSR